METAEEEQRTRSESAGSSHSETAALLVNTRRLTDGYGSGGERVGV